MLHPPDLESRQSVRERVARDLRDAPPAGFGIKAKLRRSTPNDTTRCSTRRIWNQGKARNRRDYAAFLMLHPPDLESRQSRNGRRAKSPPDAPPAGFGIKAKRDSPRLRRRGRCSTRRIGNQGKAATRKAFATTKMLHPPDLESRQSVAINTRIAGHDAPPAGFGIKAKLRCGHGCWWS